MLHITVLQNTCKSVRGFADNALDFFAELSFMSFICILRYTHLQTLVNTTQFESAPNVQAHERVALCAPLAVKYKRKSRAPKARATKNLDLQAQFSEKSPEIWPEIGMFVTNG